ncbi:hypothetical protein B6D52_01830 [Candidatus Parcubacteria bacterium 4484_255]|nr:MAG: hypothetical protein B6D52_01830 [Candidatus Parcubacteria bacterium 4484_255]
MIYSFPTLKFYIFGLLILILLFAIAWLPNAEIELTSLSEPLLLNFEINLIQGAGQPLLNLGVISSEIISINLEEELDPDYMLIDGLRDDKEEKMIVFSKKDLQKIAEYKVRNILDNSPQREGLEAGFTPIKEVAEFHPLKWEIQVIDKDLEKGRATLLVFLKEEVVMSYDLKILKEIMTSQKLSGANRILTELSGIKSVRIDNWPKFWQRLPLFSPRIKIIIN